MVDDAAMPPDRWELIGLGEHVLLELADQGLALLHVQLPRLLLIEAVEGFVAGARVVDRRLVGRDVLDELNARLVHEVAGVVEAGFQFVAQQLFRIEAGLDRKSTRLNSSHVAISYSVFCLKKKK